MKVRFLCAIFLLTSIIGTAQVSDLHTRIESGVETVQKFWAERNYEAAFTHCFELERIISQYEGANKVRLPELHYKTIKQIFMMYLNSSSVKCSVFFARMQKISDELQDEAITLDVLRSAALYYQKFGGTDEADKFYQSWIDKKMAGQDSAYIENIYHQALMLAEKHDISPLTTTLKSYHRQLHDSLRKVRETTLIETQKKELAIETQKFENSRKKTDFGISAVIIVLVILTITSCAISYILFRKYHLLMKINKQLDNDLKSYFKSHTCRDDSICSICGWVIAVFDKVKRNFSVDMVSPDLAAEIRSLNSMVKNLQEYTELDANREKMYVRKLINILPICNSAIGDAYPFLQKNVAVEISVPNQSLLIYEEGVHHVLSHLLINAALNTTKGKITIEFKRRSPRTCQIIVTDTGSGIPAEKRSSLFSPYSRIDNLHMSDGMGLPICSVIAYRMNAELKYDSGYTHGARFVLELHE